MRHFIAAILICLAFTATAQLKYDANWVFGKNCGISFVDTANPTPFYAIAACLESSSAISDSSGGLLFYTGGSGDLYTPSSKIYTQGNTPIPSSDLLRMDFGVTNGIAIIPISKRRYYFFNMYYVRNCNARCVRLEFSVIEQDGSGEFVLTERNRSIGGNGLSEKLGFVKHANGRDWWLITREHPSNGGCSDQYLKYLVQQDTIIGPFYQSVGYQFCNDEDYLGEIAISTDGSAIAMCYGYSGMIDLLSFNRCTGELEQIDTIKIPDLYPYGACFSPSKGILYVSVLEQGGIIQTQGLYQLTLDGTGQYQTIDTLLYTPNVSYFLGQLQLAPDNKIYLTSLIQADIPFLENKHLGVINFPDSVGQACGFEQYGLAVGDSCYTKLSLPNFPNYNLAPLGPYRMSAGADQVICTNDTSQQGVTIGSPAIHGISYQWISEEIDSADRSFAQITVNPDTTTLYYIEITDSSYSGSCTNSYIDSVLVEVKTCPIVGIEEPELTNITIYPNPATDQLYISLPDNTPTAQMELFSLLGAKLLQTQVHDKTPIDISQLPKGMYVYRLRVGGQYHTGKLVVE